MLIEIDGKFVISINLWREQNFFVSLRPKKKNRENSENVSAPRGRKLPFLYVNFLGGKLVCIFWVMYQRIFPLTREFWTRERARIAVGYCAVWVENAGKMFAIHVTTVTSWIFRSFSSFLTVSLGFSPGKWINMLGREGESEKCRVEFSNKGRKITRLPTSMMYLAYFLAYSSTC